MTNDLVKRLQYTVEHGIFKALEDGQYAGLDEALSRIETLEAALDILQTAMVVKKPIPLAFKKAIMAADAALGRKKND